MKHRVLVSFVDLEDRNHRYRAGDSYPRAGTDPTEERIRELSGNQNLRGIPLIGKAEDTPEEEIAAEKPPAKKAQATGKRKEG